MTIITIKNVRGGMDGDVVKLNLEDCSKGLGFTRIDEKFSPTSGRKSEREILATYGKKIPHKWGKEFST